MNTKNILGPHAPETQRVLNAARDASGLAPLEIAGSRSALDLATCSLPVSSVERLAKLWEGEAEALRMNHARNGMRGHTSSARVYAQAAQLETCAKELRAWAALPVMRQPEENTKVSHGGSAPLAVTPG